MDSSCGSEGPSVLQLHSWDSSKLQLNIAEFREAFISPSRQLLLLLSHQYEALLLPLLEGNSDDSIDGDSCSDETLGDPRSLISEDAHRSDVLDNCASTSGLERDFDNGFSSDNNISEVKTFIYDVNSIAWGACGDTHNFNFDPPFKEFLFLSGSHGVVVHAFCCHDSDSKEMSGTHPGEGRWMDWGPDTASCHHILSEETSCSIHNASENIMHENKITKDEESDSLITEGSGKDKEANRLISKRWLRSFFTEAEIVNSDGSMGIKFPPKSSFPSSAKVVSFSIFGTCFCSSNSYPEAKQQSLDDPVDHTDISSASRSYSCSFMSEVLSTVLGVGSDCCYSCIRVFSSNSHSLIGFVLMLKEFLSTGTGNGSGSCCSTTFVVVARLHSWGIKWVSSVNLSKHQMIVPIVDWTDFCFSSDLLACLAASGLICFYSVMSGEHVRELDIMQICQVNPPLRKPDQEREHVLNGLRTQQNGEASEESKTSCRRLHDGRKFRRLVGSSHTSLISAVDEMGTTYVICAADHLPDNYYSNLKLLPHFQHLELGLLVGWEVGGVSIGHSLTYPNVSEFVCEENERVNLHDNGSAVLENTQKRYLKRKLNSIYSSFTEFSASKMSCNRFKGLDFEHNLRRTVFLPKDGSNKDDCICLSPLGITRLIRKNRDKCGYQIVHHGMYSGPRIHDDRCIKSGMDIFNFKGAKECFVGDVLGCTFQNFMYLVTQHGLSVVLPQISVSPKVFSSESVGSRQKKNGKGTSDEVGNHSQSQKSTCLWSPWKAELLDRVLLYEGPEVADRLCRINGWDLKLSRIRRLQLALDFLKFDEIEKSLEMLVAVDLAEEGILRILFSATYLLFGKSGSDNEVAATSRLLALASSFATKIIRMYGLLWQKKDSCETQYCRDQAWSHSTILPKEVHDEKRTKKILHEMAYYLEAIRNLQCRVVTKFQKPGQGLVAVEEPPDLANTSILHEDSDSTSVVLMNAPSQKASDSYDYSLPLSTLVSSDMDNRALTPLNSLDSGSHLDLEDSIKSSALVPKEAQDEVLTSLRRNILPLENPQEMIARWKMDNLDLRTVVKDALLSGRLPLAVLQLHLHRSRHWMNENEQPDTFSEVRDIGRTIAYDLFLKGETKLAVATLERLGEDIKICLKQLLFGTVRRSLRLQILEEMNRCGYLGSHEWKLLERITLIERLYPSSSFWKTYHGRLENLKGITLSDNEENCLQLSLSSASINKKIGCGEIDGVILGSWLHVTGNYSAVAVNEDGVDAGYWAAAAVWSSMWDKKIIDRIVLDQPLLMGVHVLWESQLEYYISHNDWEEVTKLLDLIPASTLSDGRIQVSLDGLLLHTAVGHHRQVSFSDHFSSPLDDLDAVCMDVPDVKLFNFSADVMCSMWLRMRMEPLLAKQLIFIREYWESTSEIVPILARAGYIKKEDKISFGDGMLESPSYGEASKTNRSLPANSLHGLHKVIMHHCVEYGLPNLLDLYLDHHELVIDKDSLVSFQEAVGDCQWARWLLFSRVKGCEYDASFCNSRAITSPNIVPGNSLGVAEADGIIHTVDDIAEGGEELAALATLMFAHVPIQNCLSTGSVKRQSTSAQCTLENLKPILQRYPSLWRTFVAVCLGQDMNSSFRGNNVKNVLGTSALSDYLNWRENIFFSAGRDTSLVQMLPCWFPKSVRRLIQLYVQGPIGWQSLTVHGDADLFMNCDEVHNLCEISWEALIQKHIEDELYDSSLKDTGSSVEHYLHRGRALAAFNYLLGMRVQKLKLEQSAASVHGQMNIQSDMQTLLAPVIQSEESLLSSVMPLAILHFEDSVLVASCTFLLELCGLSASMLHVNVAALKRISSFYKSNENDEGYRQISPKASAFHARLQDDVTESLARALADEYLHQDHATITKTSDFVASRRHSRALLLVLQHLEKASLPLTVDGKTCGSWLLNGIGDGMELRSQQKAASQQWSLVIAFCRMHQLPLSTKYLAVLARDNDWVGFLSEAQISGHPFDIVMQVASKEFGDLRLRLHILTVLKNMQLKKKAGSSSHADRVEKNNISSFSDNIYVPVELFGILAECEKQKNPGEALLARAKHLSWSILAMIASCFSDVTPLTCLTVWLEITVARETSLIKVNDMASRIANNAAAAVEACNFLPAGDGAPSFHYNRRNPKRRRLMESMATNGLVTLDVEASNGLRAMASIIQSTEAEEQRKVEFSKHEMLSESDDGPDLLSKMVAVLCEQQLFLPLLRAFELFLPSCSLLPFIRALQAFSQMRLSEASAHLGSFSVRIKEEPTHLQTNTGKEEHIASSWISSTAVKAADAVISTCPSPYEKRCLLQLLAATDFGDGGYAANHYRRLYWKINLAEPSLRIDDSLHLGNETLDDASLLTALEKNGHWEQARKWAKQLEASGGSWKSSVHHVTETQAESMVAEWKEFLWDVPEERIALWGHCQRLFIRYSFPPLQAGLFFLRHAEALEKDLPAKELHELLLLALQWLSGMITLSYPVYSLNLLREIETRVWLLAVESETQMKSEGDFSFFSSNQDSQNGCCSGIIDRTANVISKMDNHINMMRNRTIEKQELRDNNLIYMKNQGSDAIIMTSAGTSTKTKRRAKGSTAVRRAAFDADKNTDSEDSLSNSNARVDVLSQDDNLKIEQSFSRWEERVGPAELERAVLSLLEFGQISAAKQLQYKLSPDHIPSEFSLVNAALKLAKFSTPSSKISISMLDEELRSLILSSNIPSDLDLIDPIQVLDHLTTIFVEGNGRGLCKKIIAVVKTANVLGISFSEAFEKQPIELLQLLSLKAQESFEEAKLLVHTHSMPAASIAHILAESFLKGLLAAHRGGYMETQKEEGPAPLLWRFSDFLKWAELCPSESEIGHALMRLVITGQEIPHACEVELLILSHHFYKSSACLDGVDVLVALAANRVDSYVSEGDFQCLARLITGVGNFHALNFILGILIENGQLDLLLQKFSAAAHANTCTAEVVRGFRMAVLTSLKQFNPNDLDAFAMVYNHFDMKHETAALLESQAEQSSKLWFHRYDKDQNEDLLESMHYYIEAAEVHSSIDAGNKTRRACAQASLVSLQIRIPDFQWLSRSETNARRALVEQLRFQEALIVAEAYGLNQPSEWAPVLWNLMFQPELIEEFVAEFVAVLPLQPSMLLELARFYRAEMAARGDQSQFSVWLTGGGLPAEWAKYLARSFRCLLKRTRDLRLRMQMASLATGFEDVIGVCTKALDKVPENAGPLVLRRGHGGAYLPLM